MVAAHSSLDPVVVTQAAPIPAVAAVLGPLPRVAAVVAAAAHPTAEGAHPEEVHAAAAQNKDLTIARAKST